jgi:glycosyltransferase involved in cell wall biosynthesis
MSALSVSSCIRVLSVDHTAGVASFRKKFDALASHPGLELTVVAPERWVENYRTVDASPEDAAGFRFRTGAVVWPGYENRAFFRTGLGASIRAARPDILHLWEEPFSVITLQALAHAALWAPRAKILFFSSDNLSRDYRYGYRPSWFYAGVERLAHRRCAAGTAVSEEVAAVLRAKGFRKPLAVIPHGIDLADYPPALGDVEEIGRRAPRAEIVERLGLEPPVVGYVGRLLRQKGVDILLRAVAALSETKASLAVIGDGPDRAALEALASELGLGRRVRFLPALPHGGVPAVLACMEVLVLPSRPTPKWKEQFGRVLVEGMAAGCVVIGSSSGAIPEVLEDAGIVFREEDADDLARALGRALGEPGLAPMLRIRGRARVRERYTWHAVAARLVDFYGQVLASPA